MPELIIEARHASISEAIRVKRILPFRQRRMVGPFIFMDHAGPVSNIPQPVSAMDVLPHPHIGLSTVSYLLDGAMTHRDSLGVEQIIRPGEVNWMTAGRGIAHSERFEDPAALAGGLELIQTWVALPEKDEEAEPSFENYTPEQLAFYTDKGIWMRMIAGEAYGLKSHVTTLSPMFYLHVQLEKGATLNLPRGYAERAMYLVHGEVETSGQGFKPGMMAVFGQKEDPVIRATQPATLMLLGGEPLGERFIWWNFVSSRRERIEQAKEDWKQGRILLPPHDDEIFIPLPKDNSRPASSKKDNTAGPEPELLS